MKRQNKILIIFCSLFILIGFLVYQNYRLYQEVKGVNKEKSVMAFSENERNLQNKLDEFYRREEIENGVKTDLDLLVDGFVKTAYQAASSEYGQVPYLRDYLTDDGIGALLQSIYPERYQEVSKELIEIIRRYPLEEEQERSLGIECENTYISLEEDKRKGNVLSIYALTFPGQDSVGVRLFLEVRVVLEAEGWKIDKIEQLEQL